MYQYITYQCACILYLRKLHVCELRHYHVVINVNKNAISSMYVLHYNNMYLCITLHAKYFVNNNKKEQTENVKLSSSTTNYTITCQRHITLSCLYKLYM